MSYFSGEVPRRISFISLASYLAFTAAGLLFGAVVAVLGREDGEALYRSLLITKRTVWVLFLPLVISAFAAYWNKRHLLMLLVPLKSFLFSYAACAMICVFSSASWLAVPLYLFSEHLSFLVYHWLWMRFLVFRSQFGKKDLLISGCVILLILLLDTYFVSPFAVFLQSNI